MFGSLTKLEYLVLSFTKKLKVFAFGGLSELSNSSLATKNPSFRQLMVLNQEHVNHRNPIDHIFNNFGEKGLSMA